MHDFVPSGDLCTFSTLEASCVLFTRFEATPWTSSGLGRVPRPLLGSWMIEFIVNHALYNMPTFTPLMRDFLGSHLSLLGFLGGPRKL